MGKLIYVDALVETIEKHCYQVRYDWASVEMGMNLTGIRQAISEQPEIQPEIIRCNDCRYADEDGVCQNSKGLAIQDDYDFCSYAERRTDGNS